MGAIVQTVRYPFFSCGQDGCGYRVEDDPFLDEGVVVGVLPRKVAVGGGGGGGVWSAAAAEDVVMEDEGEVERRGLFGRGADGKKVVTTEVAVEGFYGQKAGRKVRMAQGVRLKGGIKAVRGAGVGGRRGGKRGGSRARRKGRGKGQAGAEFVRMDLGE